MITWGSCKFAIKNTAVVSYSSFNVPLDILSVISETIFPTNCLTGASNKKLNHRVFPHKPYLLSETRI